MGRKKRSVMTQILPPWVTGQTGMSRETIGSQDKREHGYVLGIYKLSKSQSLHKSECEARVQNTIELRTKRLTI